MARLLQELDHALNPNLPVTTYDCHGNERVTLPTGVTVRQELTGVVDQMIKLHNSRNLQALITLSQQEINKKPKWLTPYLFRAEARFYFQNYTGAIADLDYFEKNKGPAYGEGTDCDQWAKELHSKLDNIPRQ